MRMNEEAHLSGLTSFTSCSGEGRGPCRIHVSAAHINCLLACVPSKAAILCLLSVGFFFL